MKQKDNDNTETVGLDVCTEKWEVASWDRMKG